MNYSEYDALPGVRSTRLKLMRTSPLHYHTAVDKQSRSLDKGSAAHVAVFEPHAFPYRYTVYNGTRRGRDWDEFKAAAEKQGLEVLYPSDWDEACAIRDAVHAHPEAAALLASGRSEQTITWTDPATGLACKARIDFLTDSGCAVDLKTARAIDDRSLSRATFEYGYHISAAFYLRGLAEVSGKHWDWAFIAAESGEPHDVRVWTLTEDALWYGDEAVGELLARVRDCEAAGEWPGAYPTVNEIDLPAWAYPSQAEADDLITIKGRS